MITLIWKIIVYVVRDSMLNLKHWYFWFKMVTSMKNENDTEFWKYTEECLDVIIKKQMLVNELKNM